MYFYIHIFLRVSDDIMTIQVEDMTNQMDRLLEGIEKMGGFKDASIAVQKKSVEKLEEGLWNLSEKCTMWRVSFLDYLMSHFMFYMN